MTFHRPYHYRHKPAQEKVPRVKVTSSGPETSEKIAEETFFCGDPHGSFDHILQAAKEHYSRLMGIDKWYELTYDSPLDMTYRGEKRGDRPKEGGRPSFGGQTGAPRRQEGLSPKSACGAKQNVSFLLNVFKIMSIFEAQK